ncbi:hypothetical protein Mkiyose1665_50550 [Mycobacterium kiyosense]|nr:hypothetical protein SRL2020130_46050 [Mycobacterium kiyosense]GLC04392.1 hypothetical protein SRL2020400_49830 [Mycobacterium kiyosense]GLC11003.1 hypothetical protein SRL2020411_56490 [Mycobacterium kiyosense]GLC16142.1 hypothetical protein SRL2020448_47450 [Mycobacterium kiyosense]GLC22327.1 hypothetical protein SRL2020472_48980 [Mycobacterium kiyosense]
MVDDFTVVLIRVRHVTARDYAECSRRGWRPCARVNPHRPRRPRPGGAEVTYLQRWRRYVERAERAANKGEQILDCPCCGLVGHDDEARARLEALIRRGGRRGQRLRVAVARLDARFMAVTVVSPRAWASAPWWEQRHPDWER